MNKDGSLMIRVDDDNHPDFWLELHLDRTAVATVVVEVVSQFISTNPNSLGRQEA